MHSNSEVIAGKPAPDFALPGSNGKIHLLHEYRGKKVILYFYSKNNAPSCTKQAEAFKKSFQAFGKLNAVIIGISKDSLKSHNSFIEKLKLPYVLLSDQTTSVAQLYTAVTPPVNLGELPKFERTTFVIDEGGQIIQIYRKVRISRHVDTLLQFLASYTASQQA